MSPTLFPAAEVQEAASYIRACSSAKPRVALVLGSGLGELADTFADSAILDTSEIPHYPKQTVEGHHGQLIFSTHRSVPLLAYQGRIHFYECGSLRNVLFPIHLAIELGVRTMILTNAAGGINSRFTPGDLMLISEQLDFTGEAIPPQGTRRRKHNSPYDKELRQLTSELAAELSIRLWRGVYAGVKGPSYETASEVEMIRRAGGDAVGMSTVLEASLAAMHGLRVIGISCITNKATGIGKGKLSHEEVRTAAASAKMSFSRLVLALVERL